MPALQKWGWCQSRWGKKREVGCGSREGVTRFLPPFPESSSALRVPLQTTKSTLLPPHAFMHFPIKFPPREERGILNPLALVIMQMLQGVDCPSLHIINVSGYEWRVCYFFPPFLCWMGQGRGAGGVMLLYLICIIRRPDWVCMRVGGTFSSVHSIKLAANFRREMQNVKRGWVQHSDCRQQTQI